MQALSTGRGTTGIGENFAKTRLLLAKRAGYLPQSQQLPAQPGQATDMWHSVSKNLNALSRNAGFSHPNQFLRQGIMQGGRIPKPIRRGGPGPMGGLINNLSAQAQQPLRMSPFQAIPGALPQPLPPLPPLPALPPMRRPGVPFLPTGGY